MEAEIDFTELIKSLTSLDLLSAKAGINEKVKYGMLKWAATSSSRLADYLMTKGPKTYDSLKLTIRDFVCNCELFGHDDRRSVQVRGEVSATRSAMSAAALKYLREGVK